jgi:hypothetical protein
MHDVMSYGLGGGVGRVRLGFGHVYTKMHGVNVFSQSMCFVFVLYTLTVSIFQCTRSESSFEGQRLSSGNTSCWP